MSSQADLNAIVVDDLSHDEDSGTSPPPDDASARSATPVDPDPALALNEAGDAPPPTPPNPDEGEGCGHPRRPNDIHHAKCEPCRIKDGILLCTHENYCHSCGLLDNDVFQQMLDDREDNAKKLKQKKDRLAARKAQPPTEPQRVSPRLASSTRPVDIRSLLQAPLPKKISPKKVSPRVHAPSLPADPTLNDLVRFRMGARRYCTSKGLHPQTAERALGIPEFADVPLSRISGTLVEMDQPSPKVTPTQRYHTPARESSPPPPVRRCLSSTPASTYQRARSNTPADFIPSESAADLSSVTDQPQDKPFRELLQLVARLSNVQALPLPATQIVKPASASFIEKTDDGPRLGLSTSPLITTILENRDREVTNLQEQGKLRDLGRITSFASLNVKMNQYNPGDDAFPMSPPQAPLVHDLFLPKLHKHNQVVLTVSDIEAMEKTARSSVRLASVIDSVIAAIMSELPGQPSDTLRRLVTWLGVIVQDNAQLAVFSATSLMQRRRDAVLANSKLSAAEKLELRTSPLAGQPALFDNKQVLEIVERARQRTNDSNLSQAA